MGFPLVSAALVGFGLSCYVARVRPGLASARVWAWLWVVLGLGDAVGGAVLAVASGGYFPRVAVAPAFLRVAAYLAVGLWGSRGSTMAAP